MARHRRKYADSELGLVLTELYAAGWRVSAPGPYFKVVCPDGCHARWVHPAPSSPAYTAALLHWLQARSCAAGAPA